MDGSDRWLDADFALINRFSMERKCEIGLDLKSRFGLFRFGERWILTASYQSDFGMVFLHSNLIGKVNVAMVCDYGIVYVQFIVFKRSNKEEKLSPTTS